MAIKANYYHPAKSTVQNLKPGYKNEVYIAPKSWFDVLEEPATGTGAAKITIVDDHTFLTATNGFLKCFMQPRKNTVKGASVGEFGGQYMDWTISLVFPGDSAELQVLVEELMNDDLILLVPDANCPGDYMWQFGCECNPGSMKSVAMDGKLVGDASNKAWTLEVQTNCRYKYEGTIAIAS